MTEFAYRKLTPKNRTLTGFSQVWLGKDHLLVVNSMRFVERYQRFYLVDIHSITIGDGPDRGPLQAAAVAISLAWILGAFLVSSSFGRGFFTLTGGVALAFAVRDIARGPRRRCMVQTTVSREYLPAVSRRRVAREFLAAITPAIAAAQANLPVPEAVEGPPRLRAEALAESPFIFPRAAEPQPPPMEQRRSYVAEILFALLIFDAGIVWAILRSPASSAVGYLLTVYAAEFTLAMVALFHRQSRFVGFAFGLVIASLLCGLVDALAVSGPAGFLTLINSARQDSNHTALSSPWLSPASTLLFVTLWRSVIGLLGLAAAHFDRRGAGR